MSIDLSVILVVQNGAKDLKSCIPSGFAAAANQGREQAAGRWVRFLSPAAQLVVGLRFAVLSLLRGERALAALELQREVGRRLALRSERG